jgi:DNA-binding CsgD family transcriptional regulator
VVLLEQEARMLGNGGNNRLPSDHFFTSEEWGTIVEALNLSSRETQIASAIVEDATEREIAVRLGISHHTVHTYVARLFSKAGVRSRGQLLVRLFGIRSGPHELTTCV